MIDALIKYFENHINITSEEREFLTAHIPVLILEKHAHLLKAGEVSDSFYFIIKGLARMYYSVEEVEKTAFFYAEQDFVSAYESFTKKIPAKFNLQVLEETQVASISITSAQKILELHPKFDFIARLAMEKELINCQEIIASFVNLNAEQRYRKLLESKPAIAQRVPQYHLATYLGVSPETLSRIRNRIRSK